MTPVPMTIMDFGISLRFKRSVELKTFGSSFPGSGFISFDPVATMHLSNVSSSSPPSFFLTITVLLSLKEAKPFIYVRFG